MSDDTNTNVRYYRYSTATTCDDYTVTGGTADTCTSDNNYHCMVIYRAAPPPRKILVTMPKEWSREKHAGWIDLINQKTRTGWVVEMAIFGGEILICDPNIERRTFPEFLELLLWRASENDKALINEFMKTA